MASATQDKTATKITREQLIEKLNQDLAREYQAIIAYTVYSQVLKAPSTWPLSRSSRSMRVRNCSTR